MLPVEIMALAERKRANEKRWERHLILLEYYLLAPNLKDEDRTLALLRLRDALGELEE